MSDEERRFRHILAEVESSVRLGDSEHLLRMLRLILTIVFPDQ
ncbi:MAG: hypothetical protein JWN86_1413 [Planctomycetota bacterium]|nr:hypothetical protein [Planctomycetota bacterium]